MHKNDLIIVLIFVFAAAAVIFIIAALFISNSTDDDIDMPYIVSTDGNTRNTYDPYSYVITSPFVTTRSVELTDDIITEDETTKLPDIDFVSLYNLIRSDIINLKTGMLLQYDVGNDDIMNVMDMLYHIDKDIFWIDVDFSCEYMQDGAHLKFIFADNLSVDEISDMQKQVNDKLTSIVSSANLFLSDYDKIRYVYDCLIDDVSYGQLSSDDEDILSHTIYGCLVNNIAVCDGYAKTFSKIMDLLGIENGIVFGSETDDEYVSHAWNYVKLDGKYYWVDLTWDDYATERSDRGRSYAYFLVSDSVLYKQHSIPQSIYNTFIPKCDKSYGQWF